jgi:hypothetical protein
MSILQSYNFFHEKLLANMLFLLICRRRICAFPERHICAARTYAVLYSTAASMNFTEMM